VGLVSTGRKCPIYTFTMTTYEIQI